MSDNDNNKNGQWGVHVHVSSVFPNFIKLFYTRLTEQEMFTV